MVKVVDLMQVKGTIHEVGTYDITVGEHCDFSASVKLLL